MTLCGGVLENVDITCLKSVRFVISSLAGHLQITNINQYKLVIYLYIQKRIYQMKKKNNTL